MADDAATILIQYLTAGLEKVIADNKRLEAELAGLGKSITSATDPMRAFALKLAGSSAKLKEMETNAYEASRMMTFMSRNLVTHPIATMKEFAASTNKAAIASSYFKEQLAFIAASRFGSIIIWGSLIAGVGKAVKDTATALVDLDREVHRVASAFTYATDSMNKFSMIQNAILSGSREFGQSYKDIGTILWELKSAGLSTSATMAGLETNQRLVVAGVSDINNATRLTAGLFRAYGASLSGATNDMERFQRIGDVLAYTLNQSQIDLDGLVQGYKFASSTAELTGLSFEDLSAILGVLNNRMLYGTTAGTSLVNAFIQLSKNWEKVIEKFNVKIDPTKTAASQMMSVIKQLHDRFGDTQLSLQQLSDLFESFNIRGGRAIAALIKGYPELIAMQNDLADGAGKVNGSLKEIADTKLDTLEGQWGRLTANVKASAVEMTGWALKLKETFRWLADYAEKGHALDKITGVDLGDKGFTDLMSGLKNASAAHDFEKTLKMIVTDSQEYLELLRQYPDALKIAFKVGPQYFEGIDSLEKLERALKITTPSSKAIGDSFKENARFIGELSESTDGATDKFDGLNKVFEETRIKLQALRVQDIVEIEGMNRGITGTKDIYQDIVNINGTWVKSLEATKGILGGITAELALAKANTPAAEIQKTVALYFESAKALDKLNAELDFSDKHTKAVETATKEWGKRAEDVYKLYLNFEKTIKEVEKAQDALNKRTAQHLDVMVKYGNLSKYDLTRQLDQQRESAEWAVLTSDKLDDQLKSREKLQSVYQAYISSGLADQRITDAIMVNSSRMLNIQQQITDAVEQRATDEKAALFSDDNIKAIQDIEEKLKGLPAAMKETSNEASETNRIMGEFQAKTKQITEKDMPLWIQLYQDLNAEAEKLHSTMGSTMMSEQDFLKSLVERGSQG